MWILADKVKTYFLLRFIVCVHLMSHKVAALIFHILAYCPTERPFNNVLVFTIIQSCEIATRRPPAGSNVQLCVCVCMLSCFANYAIPVNLANVTWMKMCERQKEVLNFLTVIKSLTATVNNNNNKRTFNEVYADREIWKLCKGLKERLKMHNWSTLGWVHFCLQTIYCTWRAIEIEFTTISHC